MITAVLALGCWLLFRRMWAQEPRRLRTAAVLVAGGWFAWSALVEVFSYTVPAFGVLIPLVLLLLPVSVVALAILLIMNGVQMARREGRSLGNLLSLLTGILLLVLPAVAVALVLTLHPLAIGAAVLAFVICAQLGLSFVTFLVFTLVYARRRPRPGPDAVVVLGAGLVRGGVGRLLGSRLDRGRAARDEQLAELTSGPGGTARAIPIITSGGQGVDEPRSEASAMAEYLVEQGVPEQEILLEDQSRTTQENLLFSRRVADASLPEATTPGHLLVATSRYHVPRAALLSYRLGIDADVVGGKAANYYVPSAYLREFVAVLTMNRTTQILLAIPGVLLSVGLTALLVLAAQAGA